MYKIGQENKSFTAVDPVLSLHPLEYQCLGSQWLLNPFEFYNHNTTTLVVPILRIFPINTGLIGRFRAELFYGIHTTQGVLGGQGWNRTVLME